MAVKLSEYYPKLRLRTVLILTAAQSIAIGIPLLIYIFLTVSLSYSPTQSISAAGATLVLIESLLIFIVTPILTEPMRLISQAVIHLSRQQDGVKPPEIDRPKHVRSGLKNLIQTLYELTVGTSHETAVSSGNREELSQSESFLGGLLEDLPCGVIALNHKREIIFANSHAPVTADTEHQKMTLQFQKGDSLDDWLAVCEQSRLHDTRRWQSIPAQMMRNSRRVFVDITAHYQKDSPVAETVIITAINLPDKQDGLSVNIEELKLQEVITPMIRTRKDKIKNRLISEDISADLPSIAADKQVISNVVEKLLLNAIGRSREGGNIVVSASVKNGFIEVSFKDYGPGISKDGLRVIFISKKLASVRSAVETLGGTISAHSSDGLETIFSFTVPIYATVANQLLKSNNSEE